MSRKSYVKTDIDTLSIKEACGIADVTRQTMYNWMNQNRFIYEKKINGYVLIDKVSFFNFINQLRGMGNNNA